MATHKQDQDQTIHGTPPRQQQRFGEGHHATDHLSSKYDPEPAPKDAAKPTPQEAAAAAAELPHSANEPPGSDTTPGEAGDPHNHLPELLSIDPDHAVIGEPGMEVTLTGEDFDETCQVTLNGESAINTEYVSDTEMKATLPSTIADAGEYPVTVKNAHGESEPVMFELVEPAKREAVKSRPKKPAKQSKKAKKRK